MRNIHLPHLFSPALVSLYLVRQSPSDFLRMHVNQTSLRIFQLSMYSKLTIAVTWCSQKSIILFNVEHPHVVIPLRDVFHLLILLHNELCHSFLLQLPVLSHPGWGLKPDRQMIEYFKNTWYSASSCGLLVQSQYILMTSCCKIKWG